MMRPFNIQRLPRVTESGQFAGRTVVNSGSTTATVSCTDIQSSSVILFSLQAATRQNSGFNRMIEVNSIVPGVSFAFATSDGIAIPRDTIVMWEIIRTG